MLDIRLECAYKSGRLFKVVLHIFNYSRPKSLIYQMFFLKTNAVLSSDVKSL